MHPTSIYPQPYLAQKIIRKLAFVENSNDYYQDACSKWSSNFRMFKGLKGDLPVKERNGFPNSDIGLLMFKYVQPISAFVDISIANQYVSTELKVDKISTMVNHFCN